MEKKFRDVVYVDSEDGSYITDAQIQFFLARPNGASHLDTLAEDWVNYESDCIIYNFLYDASESNNDEGYMFWNPNGYIDYHIPFNKKVHRMLQKAGFELKMPKDTNENS